MRFALDNFTSIQNVPVVAQSICTYTDHRPVCFVNRRLLSCCRSCRLSSQRCPSTGKLLLWSLPRALSGKQRHNLDHKLKRNNTTSIEPLALVVPKIEWLLSLDRTFVFHVFIWESHSTTNCVSLLCQRCVPDRWQQSECCHRGQYCNSCCSVGCHAGNLAMFLRMYVHICIYSMYSD